MLAGWVYSEASLLGFSCVSTLFSLRTCLYLNFLFFIRIKLLVPLRDEIDRGQTGNLTDGHHCSPETEGNIWGEGCRVCDFF